MPFSLPSRLLRPLALAAALALAGCAQPPPQACDPPDAAPLATPEPSSAPTPLPVDAAAPTPPPPADPVAQWLARADDVLRLSPPDLARRIADLGQEIAAAGQTSAAPAPTALLLALALAQTRQAADTARALALVQQLLGRQPPAAQALLPLARLLEARLLQQRRLEEQIERQSQQLREAQRSNDQLKERLEALRAIERSLSARPPPPAAPASSNGAPAP